MRRLFVMHIGPAAAYLSKHVIFAYDTQNGFQVDILSDLALDLASYTAAAIGLFAALLTICDEIDQPLIFCHSALPVSLCVVTAAGYLKYSNIASTLYLPRNRSMTRYFSLTSCQLRTKNFTATPLAYAIPPVHCCAAFLRPPHSFGDGLLSVGYNRWLSFSLYCSGA